MRSPARGRAAGQDRAAFTLVDLVMCLAIMAMVAAIAAPRYGASLARYRAELAAKRIVADLELIRMRARAQGTYESAYFYTSQDYYKMPGDPHLDDSQKEYTVYLNQAPYRADIVEASFKSGTVNYMRDGEYGHPYWGGYVIVQAGSVQKKVVVDADSGEAYVE